MKSVMAVAEEVLKLEEYSTTKATPNDTKFKRMIDAFNLHIACVEDSEDEDHTSQPDGPSLLNYNPEILKSQPSYKDSNK
ncbi:hypothetical protein Bca4012_087072 [Brassica carinata]